MGYVWKTLSGINRPTNCHDSAVSLLIFYLFSQPHSKTPMLMVLAKILNRNITLLNKNRKLVNRVAMVREKQKFFKVREKVFYDMIC